MSGAEDLPGSGGGEEELEAAHLYLVKVMTEIDEEVLRRRGSGDMPRRVEQELDALFLRYSPMSGHHGSLEEALAMVESVSFVDPVVPVRSSKAGGAVLKRTIRQASLWYMSWVTAQINRFASATSRTLRALDDRVQALGVEAAAQRAPDAPIIEAPWAQGPNAWWVGRVQAALAGSQGRVLHAAAGDGWLVRALLAGGLDAYGVEPREGRIDRSEVAGVDLREEPVLAHLRAVAPDALDGLVLTGVVDGMSAAERRTTIELAGRTVAPSGRLVIHSLSRLGWEADEAPLEADLASGAPLRPRTWVAVLEAMGFAVEVVQGPGSLDYLVIAVAEGGGEGIARSR